MSDPGMDDEGGGRAGGEGWRGGGPSGPRSPLQTMKVKNRLGSNPKREMESRERERIDLLEDVENNRANTEYPR